ncbi:MAG TPA: sodium:proton exchanger [Acidimicrobiia bacterium]|nr:sodium:proton exchanger [Acidimicrobiia bacterium]
MSEPSLPEGSGLPPVTPPPEHPGRQWAYVAIAAGFAVPGVVVRLGDIHHEPVVGAILFGIAIVAAAFALSWAAEVAQIDISRGLALAALAFIAVLPEYAVDLVFAWKAGKDPDGFAHLALANMTGANRLLIGIGWSMVVFLAIWARRRAGRTHIPFSEGEVHLDKTQSVEISFLSIATAYSLSLPLKRTLTLLDAALLVTIFIVYLVRISKAPAEHPHLVGPAQLFGSMSTAARRASVLVLFFVSAGVILAVAEPFAESLVTAGADIGIDEFLLVQWLAPLASEAPELIVAGLFAWRMMPAAGLGALVSSKVNQWTLLVGTLPIVFAISGNTLDGLPIDGVQREEIFLTAAQSVFAVAVLMNLSLDAREAMALFGLFVTQFIIGAVFGNEVDTYTRIIIGCIYLLLAAWLVIRRRASVRPMIRNGFRSNLAELAASDREG